MTAGSDTPLRLVPVELASWHKFELRIYSRAIHSDASDRVRVLLSNLRLLEAAAACELIAQRLANDPDQIKPRAWWEAVAAAART